MRTFLSLALASVVAVSAQAERASPLLPLDRILSVAKLGAVKRLAVSENAAVDRAWIVDGVFGAGRVRALAPDERFEDAVLADLSELQFRCSGALDSEFDLPRRAATTQIATAILNCRGPRTSILAIVYIHSGNSFVTLLHEGMPAHRDAVLDKQARVTRALDHAP
ncbi:hypothetical protein TMPK1_36640 [Rhodospirillales bacterium TMPK1]|uniref:Uncharacterized protein n=2 Tax=Roseiterribacter gracilis TaxID=2812848 RepID=A0A8S8XIG6_9PROT|nr:hypothetical protein TMPK1_36640 [Rhodospirillales bacterium TMPK1]